jgi:hypothetical protein
MFPKRVPNCECKVCGSRGPGYVEPESAFEAYRLVKVDPNGNRREPTAAEYLEFESRYGNFADWKRETKDTKVRL